MTEEDRSAESSTGAVNTLNYLQSSLSYLPLGYHKTDHLIAICGAIGKVYGINGDALPGLSGSRIVFFLTQECEQIIVAS